MGTAPLQQSGDAPSTDETRSPSAAIARTAWWMRSFEGIVSALCYGFIRAHFAPVAGLPGPTWNRSVRFVVRQHGRMPDFLRAPIVLLTLSFDLSCILSQRSLFRNLQPRARWQAVESARNSRLRPFRDLIRFYESLTVLSFRSELDMMREETAAAPTTAAATSPAVMRGAPAQLAPEMRCQVAVIGSGPGGSITACLLAEAGRDVVLLESAPADPEGDCPPFSPLEMERKYRNGGVTAALGRTRVAYAEAHCVGGGSEINAGLYHRTPDEVLEQWRREFSTVSSGSTDMREHFEACERAVHVSYMPPPLPLASLKLHEGAQEKGWKAIEAPRWFKYDASADAAGGVKQTMSRTFIPRALQAGARLVPNLTARRLTRLGSSWIVEAESVTAGGKRRGVVTCDSVFVCAGAIQTPALLLASGIIRKAGLRVHPSIKVVARFPETVNSRYMGVAVHQVKEFSPRLSFGCSISSAAHLSLAMLDHAGDMREVADHWPRMAAYYVMSTGGHGRVRRLPGHSDPLVSYALSDADMRDLADGLRKLCEMLFAAGATTLYPSVTGLAPLRGPGDLQRLPDCLPHGRTNLMTIHLSSSCPMGEKRSITIADSFGRVHDQQNLHIGDASLLCTAPSVNPQGSVMAFAHRNAMHYLQTFASTVGRRSRTQSVPAVEEA